MKDGLPHNGRILKACNQLKPFLRIHPFRCPASKKPVLFSSICAANEICRHESCNLYIPGRRLDCILLGFVPFGYRCWMSRFQMVFSSIWIEVLIVAASWCSRNYACKFDFNLITYDDCMKLCRSFACLLVYRHENCGRQFDRPENVGCIVQWVGVGHTFFFCSQKLTIELQRGGRSNYNKMGNHFDGHYMMV